MANAGSTTKDAPRVLHCDGCKPHAFQDANYGAKKRLHNPTSKGNPKAGAEVYRCTVCGTERGKL
jgi:hypothetical protein